MNEISDKEWEIAVSRAINAPFRALGWMTAAIVLLASAIAYTW